MYKYSCRIFWSDEDNAYVATCPELPGVSAVGKTEEEAVREAKIAMKLYIEDMLESGESPPEAQTATEYSGQTRLRMPKQLHRLVAELAAAEGVSQNQYILDAVRLRISGEQQGKRYLDEITKRLDAYAKKHTIEMVSLLENKVTEDVIKAEVTVTRVNRSSEYARIKGGN